MNRENILKNTAAAGVVNPYFAATFDQSSRSSNSVVIRRMVELGIVGEIGRFSFANKRKPHTLYSLTTLGASMAGSHFFRIASEKIKRASVLRAEYIARNPGITWCVGMNEKKEKLAAAGGSWPWRTRYESGPGAMVGVLGERTILAVPVLDIKTFRNLEAVAPGIVGDNLDLVIIVTRPIMEQIDGEHRKANFFTFDELTKMFNNAPVDQKDAILKARTIAKKEGKAKLVTDTGDRGVQFYSAAFVVDEFVIM